MLATMDAAPVSKVMSPEELDTLICEAYVLGNDVRRKLIMALAAMEESRLYLLLGFSSIYQYGEKRLRCGKSQVYEFLRVAKALRRLPKIDHMFRVGPLSWSDVREVVKVATPETEDKWIEFAKDRSTAQVEAEVKDALRNGRKAPRSDRYGLPSVTTRIGFELEPYENDLLEKALRKAKIEIGQSVGEAPVELKDALLYVARQFLESDPAGGVGRVERDDSIHTILYHRCPECRKVHLPTLEGPVEIPGEVVDRIESEAKKVTIAPEEEAPAGQAEGTATPQPVPVKERDRPNTPSIVKKVLLRDGQACANPMCGAKLGLHAHHIQFRVHGGKTELVNEVAVCSRCHSLLHAGLLRIEGDPLAGLKWIPKRAEVDLAFGEELARAGSMAEVHVTPAYENSTMPHSFSTRVENECEETDKALLRALVQIGYEREHAIEMLAAAHKVVEENRLEPSHQNLFNAAVRAA